MGLLEGLLELLCPTRCAGCDMPGQVLCGSCHAALPQIERASACVRCGAPFGHLVCTECWHRELAFSASVCFGSLEHPLARCMTLYKDAGERRLGRVLGEALAADLSVWSGWPDAVVPVPASPHALRTRGFDHTYMLAERVARELDTVAIRALSVRPARDQRRLGRVERAQNVAGAFTVMPGVHVPAKVLLVDDVMTTGATLDTAAGALLAAGADEVRVGAVARAW
ncbi:MAG: ComF family protein [Clostridiales bacterium]|nr:ComF family protein [Clostridiales bacterium]